MKNKLDQEVRIVQCNTINVAGKDIIDITKKEDFLYILGNDITVYEYDGHYQIISDTIIWGIKKWR